MVWLLKKLYLYGKNKDRFYMNNMRYDKGISPLIAAILLIAISVIVAAILLNWSTLLTYQQTQDITNETRQISKCGILTVESVYLDFASNRSRVFVKSIVEDTLDSAKLVTSTGLDMPLNTKLPLQINKGEIKILEFNLTSNLSTCANFSQVIIGTRCSTIIYDQEPTNC